MNQPNKSPDRSDVQGILVIDKPVGFTSMRAVAIVRRCCRVRKTGHAGTLDPLASGILVIAIGRATKSLNKFMNTTKRYRTIIDLSAVTVTNDLESQPTPVEIVEQPTRQKIDEALLTFTGSIEQTPPAHSAIQIGGVRSYEFARQGIDMPLASRTVQMHELRVVHYDWPMLEIEILCSKGMYVRSLARDIGRALGTGGYCTALRRTAVGPFDESMAVKLDDIQEPVKDEYIIPLERALKMVEDDRK